MEISGAKLLSDLFFGVFSILIVIFILYKAYQYHTEKIFRNSEIINKINEHQDQKYILLKDLVYFYFCRQDQKRKKFIIKKGTVLYRYKKYGLFCLKNGIDAPDEITINFGTKYWNFFVFKLSKKNIKETDNEFLEVDFILIDDLKK